VKARSLYDKKLLDMSRCKPPVSPPIMCDLNHISNTPDCNRFNNITTFLRHLTQIHYGPECGDYMMNTYDSVTCGGCRSVKYANKSLYLLISLYVYIYWLFKAPIFHH
jgi:hypothetical protein